MLVLCHGFPVEPQGAQRTGAAFAALADRLAAESGWRVVTGALRGVAPSAGDFSPAGWLEDIATLVDRALVSGERRGAWIAGFGTGGALALCLAARQSRVRGVACFGAPATVSDWAQDLPGLVALARRVGVIRTPGYPSDLRAWGEPFRSLAPATAAARVAPRPLLVVHGAEDDAVPVGDARTLADAGGPAAELRILPGAGHNLRADPRAVALLVGWLERQGP